MTTAIQIGYHAPCADGFAAAWVAWKKFGEQADYFPLQYGKPWPENMGGAEREVYLLDFSYPRDLLMDLKNRSRSLLVLDHHASAQRELEGLKFAQFDMERSGARMAWDHFFPGQTTPALVAYVEDRDLWRFRLPFSREVSAALSSYPMEFALWEKLAADLPRLQEEGVICLRVLQSLTERICARMRWVQLGEYRVPSANTPVLGSEVGERLLQAHPQAPFVACYFQQEDGKQVWGLRSRDGFDVSRVAARYGGGGHAQAAGFAVKPSQDPDWPASSVA
jgi:uncharacterized protein